MKNLLNTILLLTLFLCYYSCIDSKFLYEPEVTTYEATDVTSMSAAIYGSVEKLVTEEFGNIEIGIVYSNTNCIPSIDNGNIITSGYNTNGDFIVFMHELSVGVTYYYRAYVKTGNKVYYGEVLSFTTQAIIVTTSEATFITSVSAIVGGSVENLVVEEGTNVEFGIIYSSTDSVPNIDNGNVIQSDNNTVGDFSISLTELTDGVTYYYRAYAKIDDKVYYGVISSFTTKYEITPGQEVDLGLSVKWAGWNVGAISPEEYGGYYAWGETEEKSEYSLATYKYYNDSIGIGGEICGTQYDVATVKWGSGWRMPSKAEIEELNSKCTFDGYSYKGVSGCKVTGPNGNTIFLPCAGYRNGTSLYDAGSYGFFWSGSLSENYSYNAWYLSIASGGCHDVYDGSRGNGLSVRPVRDY